MKVLLVNGSPRPAGCTYTALSEIAAELEQCGVQAEIFQAGAAPIGGCIGGGGCAGKGACVFGGPVNELIEKAKTADGFIFGTPVHYASASGALTSLLDRAFYAGSGNFRCKPGAAVASARRAGTTAALDQVQKYFTITNMPIVGSQYWNMVHGNTPDEVRQDTEGLQTLRQLARNMAWLLKCIEAGRAAGVPMPGEEPRMRTNFIR